MWVPPCALILQHLAVYVNHQLAVDPPPTSLEAFGMGTGLDRRWCLVWGLTLTLVEVVICLLYIWFDHSEPTIDKILTTCILPLILTPINLLLVKQGWGKTR